MARALHARRSLSGDAAKAPESGSELGAEQFGLFPRGEVPALVEFVEIDEFGIRPLCPTTRSRVELVRKDAHRNGDGNAFNIEIPEFVLPIESGARKRRVRQPGERDVVEDVVSCEAGGFTRKDARDQLVAARVVVKKIGRQADRGICNSVHRLRAQPQLESVGDALGAYKLQSLVSDFLFC